MRETAFSILGIEPTRDRARVREAYLRLARIYHPDRHVDQPEDVRVEAERRMKAVSEAYGSVMAWLAREPERAPISRTTRDKIRRQTQARDAEAQRLRREELERLERWERWDRLERLARERAENETTLIDLDPADLPGGPDSTTKPATSSLAARLARARGVEDRSLAKPGES